MIGADVEWKTKDKYKSEEHTKFLSYPWNVPQFHFFLLVLSLHLHLIPPVPIPIWPQYTLEI